MHRIAQKKAGIIVTGHHSEDYLESLLLFFIRGGGEKALQTLPVFQDNVFRPLLLFSQTERMSILENLKIPVFEDESNWNLKYTRNRIRHKIVGELYKEGLNADKLYWNFHEKNFFLSAKQAPPSYLKVYLPETISSINLKKIMDTYLQILNLHPIKKKLLEEMYVELLSRGSIFKENRELYFWKSKSTPVYLVPKNSPVLAKPILNSNREIDWNRKKFQLGLSESLDSFTNQKKIALQNKHFVISELLREREIPPFVRENIPLVVEKGNVKKICFHLWDDNLSDFPKG